MSRSSIDITLSGGSSTAAQRHEVRDPGDISEVVGTYPLHDVASIDALVDHAETAQRDWAARTAAQRWEVMRAAAATIPHEELATLLVREQGKPLAEASMEMTSLGIVLDRYRPHAEWLTESNASPRSGRTVRHRPFGVCGVITPWNWPFRIACALTVPALIAGNAVVLHLSPSAPLASAQAFRVLADALPDGALSIVTHPDPDLASRLVEHPRVRKIAFTGSTGVGRIIMGNASQGLKNLTLELGGNDPAVILEDVEPSDELADQLVRASYATTGQVCMAIKRLYVPETRVPDFVAALAARLEREVVGHGLDADTTMGPLHTRAQRASVQRLVRNTVAGGATATEHGSLTADPDQGWYMRPTLVHGIAPDAELVTEEQFGPALPIVGYSSVDQAVGWANESEYGLCSSVWSADEDRAFEVAEQIEAGTTWINKHGMTAQDPEAPFGGVKSSGVGRISGSWGLKAFLEPQSILA